MKEFKVQVEYPAYATYEIEANNAEEAIAKAKAMDEGDDPEEVCIDFDAKAKFSIEECWMYSDSVQDMNGRIPFQLVILGFTVGERAFLENDKGFRESARIVACLLDAQNADQMLSDKTVGAWFSTDRGNIFVIAERNR